jgi:hypothetical protein
VETLNFLRSLTFNPVSNGLMPTRIFVPVFASMASRNLTQVHAAVAATDEKIAAPTRKAKPTMRRMGTGIGGSSTLDTARRDPAVNRVWVLDRASC